VTGRWNAAGRALAALAGGALAAAAGWYLFVDYPADLVDLLGLLLAVGLAVAGVRVAGRLAGRRFPSYNVAEVAVEGPITRDGGSPSRLPGGVAEPGADDLVAAIERADEDPNAAALALRLNTPGGAVVPSDDIRRAAAEFDGPTVAYAVDTCASGGYWIATACDELWAREATLVGSIGVLGSRPNVAELADDLGIAYERFAAGEYKDAGLPLKELSADERAYLQGIVDDYYEEFVERVAEGRGMDPEAVRETEARLYLGRRARDLGLVDALGDGDDALDDLEDRLGEPTRVREFSPESGLATRLRGGAEGVAYAFGAGVADRAAPADGFDFEF